MGGGFARGEKRTKNNSKHTNTTKDESQRTKHSSPPPPSEILSTENCPKFARLEKRGMCVCVCVCDKFSPLRCLRPRLPANRRRRVEPPYELFVKTSPRPAPDYASRHRLPEVHDVLEPNDGHGTPADVLDSARVGHRAEGGLDSVGGDCVLGAILLAEEELGLQSLRGGRGKIKPGGRGKIRENGATTQPSR